MFILDFNAWTHFIVLAPWKSEIYDFAFPSLFRFFQDIFFRWILFPLALMRGNRNSSHIFQKLNVCDEMWLCFHFFLRWIFFSRFFIDSKNGFIFGMSRMRFSHFLVRKGNLTNLLLCKFSFDQLWCCSFRKVIFLCF